MTSSSRCANSLPTWVSTSITGGIDLRSEPCPSRHPHRLRLRAAARAAFRIADAFAAELVEVTELPGESGGRAPFSLVFEGGPSQPLPQAIYPVHHERLGETEIFLVPIAPDRYEAVFT